MIIRSLDPWGNSYQCYYSGASLKGLVSESLKTLDWGDSRRRQTDSRGRF